MLYCKDHGMVTPSRLQAWTAPALFFFW